MKVFFSGFAGQLFIWPEESADEDDASNDYEETL